MLNTRQYRAAVTLRQIRPANIETSYAARQGWYDKIAAAMVRTQVATKHHSGFRFVAGVQA